MNLADLNRRAEAVEADQVIVSDGSLADKLAKARGKPYAPTHTGPELEHLATRDDLTGRVARGLLRLGDAYHLVSAPRRKAPVLDAEGALVAIMGSLTHNPLGFVLFAFPWNEPGSDLAGLTGPRTWQREELVKLGDRLSATLLLDSWAAIQLAITSGNGSGKSALASWLTLFSLCTYADTRVIITASSENQLRSKTAPELARWYQSLICRGWFDSTVTAIFSSDKAHEKGWRCDLLPWNAQRPETAAGLHNRGRRLLFLIDEASGVDDPVFEVAKGSMTDERTEMMFVILGNPLRAEGAFFEAITKYRDEWHARNIDTRTVEGVNQEQLAKYIAAYGLDSDFCRTRILGIPPRASSMSFFARADLDVASERIVPDQAGHPICVGLDPARFGDDESVIATRRGRDGRSFPLIRMKGLDTVAVVARLIEYVNLFKKANYRVQVFCDGSGLGGGHVDVARAHGLEVTDVIFGARAMDPVRYFNRRSEMYGKLKEWIPTAAIANDKGLIEDLVHLEYGFDGLGRLQLERKEDLKRRLGRSPDAADALALTFAVPVAIDLGPPKPKHDPRDYDPYKRITTDGQGSRGHDPYRRR